MWQSDYVETDDIKLHYTRTGGDKPPLLLLHGFSGQGIAWKPVADVLAADYDVIMPDARGHGLTDAPQSDDGWGWPMLIDDVRRIIQTLELEKPVILGHSMGAVTTLRFTATYPDVPRAIILEDPPAHWMPREDTAEDSSMREAQFREQITSLKAKSAEQMIADHKRDHPKWSDEALKYWAESKQRLNINIMKIFSSNQQSVSDVTRVKCPVLLITGEPQLGAILTSETAQSLKPLIPQVQIEHIENASHDIWRDEFDAYMQVVTSFLKSL